MINNQDFFEKMKELQSFDSVAYCKSFNVSPKKSIRINNIKVNGGKVNLPFSVTQNKVNPDLYYVDNEEKVGNTIEHHCGMFYVQEPAASMPAFSIKDKLTGKVVLDLCASPGGKTTQLAEYVGPTGLVISNEVVSKRVNILRGNVERLGLTNVVITNNNAEQIARALANAVDVVVVDAPCSGEGMFRKDPDTVQEWSLENVYACAKRQLFLLQNVDNVLKNDGILVYSTCTFNKNENEMVIQQFLNEHPNYYILDVDSSIKTVSKNGESNKQNNRLHLERCRRFYPQDGFGEGQFFCVLQKHDKNTSNIKYNAKNKQTFLTSKEFILVKKFLDENFILSDYLLTKVGGQFFILPKVSICMDGLNVVINGVCVGEIVKDRFEPHHHLYMAYGKLARNKLDITNYEDAKRYIAGGQIVANINDGYCAVLYNGVTIGFGKCNHGVINNHYPKGLRKIL